MALLIDHTFCCLYRTPTYDRQTDRRMDKQTHDDSIHRVSIASSGNYVSGTKRKNQIHRVFRWLDL